MPLKPNLADDRDPLIRRRNVDHVFDRLHTVDMRDDRLRELLEIIRRQPAAEAYPAVFGLERDRLQRRIAAIAEPFFNRFQKRPARSKSLGKIADRRLREKGVLYRHDRVILGERIGGKRSFADLAPISRRQHRGTKRTVRSWDIENAAREKTPRVVSLKDHPPQGPSRPILPPLASDNQNAKPDSPFDAIPFRRKMANRTIRRRPEFSAAPRLFYLLKVSMRENNYRKISATTTNSMAIKYLYYVTHKSILLGLKGLRRTIISTSIACAAAAIKPIRNKTPPSRIVDVIKSVIALPKSAASIADRYRRSIAEGSRFFGLSETFQTSSGSRTLDQSSSEHGFSFGLFRCEERNATAE